MAGKKEELGDHCNQCHLNGFFSLRIPRGWGGCGDVVVVVHTVDLVGGGRGGDLGGGMEGG